MLLIGFTAIIVCYIDLIRCDRAFLQAEQDKVTAEIEYERRVRETHRSSRKNALLLLRAVQKDIKLGTYHWERMKAVVDSFYPEVE